MPQRFTSIAGHIVAVPAIALAWLLLVFSSELGAQEEREARAAHQSLVRESALADALTRLESGSARRASTMAPVHFGLQPDTIITKSRWRIFFKGAAVGFIAGATAAQIRCWQEPEDFFIPCGLVKGVSWGFRGAAIGGIVAVFAF